MRNEKGITLIKLCIFIVIFIVIIMIGINSLKESYEISNIQKFVIEMELIQEKVNLIRREYKTWEEYDSNEPGNFYEYLQTLGYDNANGSTNIYIEDFNKIINELSNNNTIDCWDNTDSIIANYCYFNPQSLESKLGLENVNQYVIINFYTGNVISKDGIKDKFNSNKLIHRQYDTKIGKKIVSTSINNKTILPKIEVLENNGLTQKVKVYLSSEDKNIELIPNISEVYYYDNLNDETKNKCSDLNGYSYEPSERAVYFTIENSGEYSFIIEDTNHIQYSKLDLEISLCNPPVLLNDMTGIYWDKSGNEIEVEKNNDINWYNYASNEVRMANAKTSDGNYWVWIPRYIYKQTENNTTLDFVYGTTTTSTKNKATTGYKEPEEFLNDKNLKGIWISKFQVNDENSSKMVIKPGQTLTVVNTKKAKENCNNLPIEPIRKYSKLMSEAERNVALLYSKAMKIEIANNLIHYSGGAPSEKGFIENTKYSSTGNIFGIYDLITSENEVTINSLENEEGRYRPVLLVK